MKWLAALLVLLLIAALALACEEEEAATGPPSPAATVPASPLAEASPSATPRATPEVTPSPEATATFVPTLSATEEPTAAAAVACAAGSTSAFLEAQEEAPFLVYCPTFLPAGLTLEGAVSYFSREELQAQGPLIGATFSSSAPEVTVNLVQGVPALSLLTTGIRSSGGGGTGVMVLYGDFEVELYLPGDPSAGVVAVLGTSPDGVTHWIEAQGLTEDELKQIAASMNPVFTNP